MLGGASRFLRNPFKLWDLEIARNQRSGASALHRPGTGAPLFSICSTASDLYPPTDCELLGNKCCLARVTSQSALLGAGLREHLPHHLVSSAASGPRPASTDPATAGNACQSPPSLTSISLLNPKVSGFAHSPQRNLRSQGFPPQLLTTPDRWSLGTGYPRAQNEVSLSRTKPEDPLNSGRGQPFRAAIHRRERGGSDMLMSQQSAVSGGRTAMRLKLKLETVKTVIYTKG